MRFLIAFALSTCSVAAFAQETQGDFEAVALMFQTHCIGCHNANDPKGGLSLASADAALAGGESGVVIAAGQPDSSVLLDYTRGPDPAMPPEGDPLSDDEVATLDKWIANGAVWPNGRKLVQPHLQDNSWWSLRPLKSVDVPDLSSVAEYSNWPRNAVDHFILKQLQSHRLHPAQQASRRTLIRRLYFDLIGLPPTPAAIETFLTDTRSDAYERLVDRLLDSQHYGERWARHWLDVVHYADTHGYDKDKPRANAWPYRDYVIRSLNSDKPWSRFVREQIAGDVLYPNTRDGIEALGFISAGPWDFVGHAEVSEDKIDGKIARHLDRDDMVRTTMQSFLGLTVGCAQCHDHKFDPILQLDYYKLHAVFAALDRADRKYDLDPDTHKEREDLSRQIESGKTAIGKLRRAAETRAAKKVKAVDDAIAKAESNRRDKPDPEFGYHSRIVPMQASTKWVQIDLGKPVSIRRVVLRPCTDDFNNIGDGFGFPIRFRIDASEDRDFRSPKTIADVTERDFPNPKLNPVSFAVGDLQARFVRITATKLAPRKNDFIFALAEVQVHDDAGVNRAASAKIESLDSIQAPPRWRRSNLTDGKYAVDESHTKSLKKRREQLVLVALTSDQRVQLKHQQAKVAAAEKRIAALPKQATVYAGTIHHGKGKFVGTGAKDGNPRPIHRLQRGDIRTPMELVNPGALTVLGLPQHFELDATHAEGQRRAALARWLTDRENPLTWRAIVNRVWLYHFGHGIAATPNDLGKMGAPPSHPLLLDYLAARFRDEGQSLKQLHRLIVTSATYRQSSQADPAMAKRASAVDANNQLLWKMPRRKLEAEAIRDSMLMVSGKLNTSMYGPAYRDFVLKQPQHSPHYEYHLHDPNDGATHRRSVYRFLVRSQLEPFMSSLDCADPSILVGKRNQSLTPLQSLTMLNSGLTVTMADHFASKLQQHETVSDQIRHGFLRAIGREPSRSEQAALTEVARQHGLANACRLIFNLNEFSFVD